MIEISSIEVLALKKLMLVNHTLAGVLSDGSAAREQRALTEVLARVICRADQDNLSRKPLSDTSLPEGASNGK